MATPASTSADRNGASWRSFSFWLTTIRARLYIAFGFAATMTVIGSLIALYIIINIDRTMNEIVSRSIPATVESLRLAEGTGGLVASAPQLMTAGDELHRNKVASQIAEQARDLAAGISRLRSLDASRSSELHAAQTEMVKRLDALNQAVTDRIAISEKRQTLALSIRKAHEEILEGLAPAIDDANFDLTTKSQTTGNKATLNDLIESLRLLLEIQAESNLLAGLLTEASMVTESARLKPLRDLIDAARRKIEANLKVLADSDLQKKLTALYRRLAAVAGDDGIIALRTDELGRQRDAQTAFMATQTEATKLKQAVDSLVEQQGKDTAAVSAHAAEKMRSGQILLILLSITALVAAGLIAWLYVGRNIADRLGLLSSVMRRIAGGDLTVEIPKDGGDEIADMARTLLVFRKATADVAAARQSEAGRAQTSEANRQQVEVATRNFKQAVHDVVRALDSASISMDSSARAMADNADRNREQTLITAAASEEATINVNHVAVAAHEMAQSIELVANRVTDSATIARQAASEAQTITGTVEGLAASVNQIANVSKLIRSIASQTNLLALNATIEAARAGDAGRGFAIVAQEVKGLAVQTEKATEAITRQISSIEGITSHAIHTMKAIAATIARLDDIANEVAATVQQQGSVTREIAKSASAASDGTRGVSENVGRVSHAATEMGQVANSVLGAAGELAAQSNMLRSEVERFLVQVRVA